MKVLFVFVALLLSSCVTYQKCVDKFGTQQPSKPKQFEKVIDSLIKVISQAKAINGAVNSDSLIQKILAFKDSARHHKKLNDSLLLAFGDKKLNTQVWYDARTNQVKGKTQKLPDTVFIHLKDTVRVVADCPPAMVFDPIEKLPWYAPPKLWDRYKLFAAWVLLALVVISSIYAKFKR
jgi:hypothetical protein